MQKQKSPVLFLIFNRPDITLKTFEAIILYKPSKLFVASDGARSTIVGESDVVINLRKEVLKLIDWKCEIYTLFSDENQGCGRAVSKAITWFFNEVEQGIILEDDCYAHPDFFEFCTELLMKYESVEHVKFIGGSNFQDGKLIGDGSFYFSNYCHVWGWASWRRVWKDYNFSLTNVNKGSMIDVLNKRFRDKEMIQKWYRTFEQMIDNPIDTWDYQLVHSIWINDGIAVIPKVNLISNIGFGKDATHTFNENSKFACQPLKEIMPLQYPSSPPNVNLEADERYFYHYESRSLISRIKRKVRRFCHS